MSNASGLTPVNDHLLVELGGQYKNIQVKEGKYDSRTSGIVVAYGGGLLEMAAVMHKRVYWGDFKEGTRVEKNGVLYAFIKAEDVMGVEDVE
jgi:co-chaperonin GroES (HSP10)